MGPNQFEFIAARSTTLSRLPGSEYFDNRLAEIVAWQRETLYPKTPPRGKRCFAGQFQFDQAGDEPERI